MKKRSYGFISSSPQPWCEGRMIQVKGSKPMGSSNKINKIIRRPQYREVARLCCFMRKNII